MGLHPGGRLAPRRTRPPRFVRRTAAHGTVLGWPRPSAALARGRYGRRCAMNEVLSQGESVLLERERELERLLDALDHSRREAGMVVAVTGPIGIGKSR